MGEWRVGAGQETEVLCGTQGARVSGLLPWGNWNLGEKLHQPEDLLFDRPKGKGPVTSLVSDLQNKFSKPQDWIWWLLPGVLVVRVMAWFCLAPPNLAF